MAWLQRGKYDAIQDFLLSPALRALLASPQLTPGSASLRRGLHAGRPLRGLARRCAAFLLGIKHLCYQLLYFFGELTYLTGKRT
jgi:hypothetical protein